MVQGSGIIKSKSGRRRYKEGSKDVERKIHEGGINEQVRCRYGRWKRFGGSGENGASEKRQQGEDDARYCYVHYIIWILTTSSYQVERVIFTFYT